VNDNVHEIYEDMLEKERDEDYRIDPYYFEKRQREINWSMRVILVIWMRDVCNDLLMTKEAYYYSVSYVDRYLSMTPNIKKMDLQLVGVTALLLASKMEEIESCELRSLVVSTAGAYTLKQIMDMEVIILKTLKCKLFPQTTYNWASYLMLDRDKFVDSDIAKVSTFFQNRP